MPHSHRARNPFVLVGLVAISALAVVVGLVAFTLVRRGDQPQDPSAGPTAPAPTSAAGMCGDLPLRAERDLRGMTLTTVVNIDWPSQPGLDEATVRREYLEWLDLAVAQRHNAIFVHIRPSGDAFWPSEYAPWSEWLTGNRTGADPGWDPLEFMVAEAHARNLEFHGWFNPYRGGQPGPRGPGGDLNNLAPDHPLREHPEWAIVYPIDVPGGNTTGTRLYFDPGIPDARRFVQDSILEAVQRYDLDGVFFDDYFYPYREDGQEFGDDASYAQYGGGLSRADWRRSNVDTMFREMGERIKQVKPWVKFGVSPFGIWRNVTNDPEGSQTRGLSAYDEIFADARRWIREQWIDFVMPQLYWHIGNPPADYATLVRWWSDQVQGTRVHLYTAHGDYRIGESGAWSDPGEIDRQLTMNRSFHVSGSVHFTAHDIREDKLGAVTRYRDAHYAAPAFVPAMPHLPAAPPGPPHLSESTVDDSGAVTLRWRPGTDVTTSYGIYRYGPQDDAAVLVATVRATGEAEQSWSGSPAPDGPYGYCITGLDRSWNEGAASTPVTPANA